MPSRLIISNLDIDHRTPQRLDCQHRMWKHIMGGLYPVPAKDAVSEALSPRDANKGQPAVLDIGSGPGFW